MTWICVGCKQVQDKKDQFAPVLNHTHYVEEVQAAPEAKPHEEDNTDLTGEA